jgi:RNA polymerase-binding protein DksA
MPKKKPTRIEARPRKKKEQRTVSKAAAGAKSSARASRQASPGKPAAGASRPAAKAATAKAATAKAATIKPLARVKAPSQKTAPASAIKAPPKPSKPARRIPNSELNKIRSFLSQKKIALTNHLQSELSELEKPEKRHRTDLEEIASDTHDTDSLCEIMDIEASQIGQIDMALTKIDNGTYGICEDCGGEIPLIRLEALPFATQCIDCKRKAEIEGRISAER